MKAHKDTKRRHGEKIFDKMKVVCAYSDFPLTNECYFDVGVERCCSFYECPALAEFSTVKSEWRKI